MSPRALLAAGLATALVDGCGFAVADLSSVPANPTWEGDVKPYLADHCLVCHGDRARRGADSFFRLDVFNLDDPANSDEKLGACDMRSGIYQRAVVRESMPPVWLGEGLGPNGKEMLRRWITQLDPNNPCGY